LGLAVGLMVLSWAGWGLGYGVVRFCGVLWSIVGWLIEFIGCGRELFGVWCLGLDWEGLFHGSVVWWLVVVGGFSLGWVVDDGFCGVSLSEGWGFFFLSVRCWGRTGCGGCGLGGSFGQVSVVGWGGVGVGFGIPGGFWNVLVWGGVGWCCFGEFG